MIAVILYIRFLTNKEKCMSKVNGLNYKSARNVRSGMLGEGDSEAFTDRKYFNKAIGKLKHYKKREKINAYMNSEHTYQLYRGDSKFLGTKIMTGTQAWTANKEYEDKFFFADKEGARLWRYNLVKNE